MWRRFSFYCRYIVKVLFDDVFSVFEHHIDFAARLCVLFDGLSTNQLLLLTILSPSQ